MFSNAFLDFKHVNGATCIYLTCSAALNKDLKHVELTRAKYKRLTRSRYSTVYIVARVIAVILICYGTSTLRSYVHVMFTFSQAGSVCVFLSSNYFDLYACM
jgi:hypothetical protein